MVDSQSLHPPGGKEFDSSAHFFVIASPFPLSFLLSSLSNCDFHANWDSDWNERGRRMKETRNERDS